MKTQKIDGWEITPEAGVGLPPEFKPMTFYCVVGPKVRTETRANHDGMKRMVPTAVYEKFMATQS